VLKVPRFDRDGIASARSRNDEGNGTFRGNMSDYADAQLGSKGKGVEARIDIQELKSLSDIFRKKS
jgi:hypothetical protein